MRLKLPAVSEPIIRVIVVTPDHGRHHLDYLGERPQEVDVVVPDVEVEKCKVGYVGVAGNGEEVGEPNLLYEPSAPKLVEPKPKPPAGFDNLSPNEQARVVVMGIDVTTNGETVLTTELPPENQLPTASDAPKTAAAAEAPPETVKAEEKVEVKTTRKGK